MNAVAPVDHRAAGGFFVLAAGPLQVLPRPGKRPLPHDGQSQPERLLNRDRRDGLELFADQADEPFGVDPSAALTAIV